MRFIFTKEQDNFRKEIQDFIIQSRTLPKSEEEFPRSIWNNLAERRWIGPMVPSKYGGAGRSFVDQAILIEEIYHGRLPEPINLGYLTTSMFIYALLTQGTEQQREFFLPSVIKGELVVAWGQTEPEAGSDYGNAQASAKQKGERFIINGTKLFNFAHFCTHICTTTKTTAGPRYKGISLFLVEMKSQGIEMYPIWMPWNERRDEVHFTDVEVSQRNLIGVKDQGWDSMHAATSFEWHCLGGIIGAVNRNFQDLVDLAKDELDSKRADIPNNAPIRHIIADLALDIEVGRLFFYQTAWLQDKKLPFFVSAARSKLFTTELMYKFINSAMDVAGLHSVLERSREASKWLPLKGRMPALYKAAPAATTAGLTPQMQRNALARELGLPI